jgi:drug/metabolite transporter (DMT)-like permease
MFTEVSKSTRVWIAFACVYLCWGSTYLAIHIAGEQLPTPVISCLRCVLSALFIFGICVARGMSLRVPKDEIWKLIVIGILFMSFNNMGLTWGEKMVPSGFASLVISMMPILIALLEMGCFYAGWGGETLNKRGWAGTLLGTLGICLLVWPSLHGESLEGFSRPVLGTFVLLGAALSFAVGSVLSRRFQFKAETFVATGWQITAAAVFNALLVLSTGGLQRSVWTWRGFGAVVYLAIFGSLFGLVAFTYLLKNVRVTKVSTYAFVNPMIAVLLGVLILHERLNPAELLGMAVIVCAVAMVIYSRVGLAKGNDLSKEVVGSAGEAVE